MLGDEPIASLDRKNTKIVMEIFYKINKDLGKTLILNLHHLDLAKDYCDRILGISNGMIVYNGVPNDLDFNAVSKIYK